jgi:hypothetical protein
MKMFTTLFALVFVGLIFLTSIVDVASASFATCGTCNIQANNIGVVPLVGYVDSNNKPVFTCNKLSEEDRLSTCVNDVCDFCVVWK